MTRLLPWLLTCLAIAAVELAYGGDRTPGQAEQEVAVALEEAGARLEFDEQGAVVKVDLGPRMKVYLTNPKATDATLKLVARLSNLRELASQ